MLFLVKNETLIKDREKTFLTAAYTSGTTLTVRDINSFAVGDYFIIGRIGDEATEIGQLHAATSPSGTTITLASALSYTHSIDAPVQRIDFNQVEYSRAATEAGAKSVLTTIAIQPDDLETRYNDTANTTGYGFVRFKNSSTVTYSSYSDSIPYAGQSKRSLAKLIKKVRSLINEKTTDFIEDDEIIDTLNDKQDEIAHDRLWSFFEGSRSFSSVDNQFAYDIPVTVQKVHTIRFDTQPLAPVDEGRWEILHWDTDQSTSKPTHAGIWDRQIKVYPRPDSDASTTTLDGDHTATDTTITVADTSEFNRGDYYRMIINDEVIYATAATSTTFTGALRGQEGTTAATHTDGDTVTERDIVYTTHEEAVDLSAQNDETSIPEPLVLALGTSADLALKLQKETLHDRLLNRYKTRTKELESKYASKQTGSFSRVKLQDEVISDVAFDRNPNNFPSSVGN